MPQYYITEHKRMSQRHGTYEQFIANVSNLLAHEFASVISGDPSTTSGKALYFYFGTGSPDRILTDEDKSQLVEKTTTIAGIDLQDDISVSELQNALYLDSEQLQDAVDNYLDEHHAGLESIYDVIDDIFSETSSSVFPRLTTETYQNDVWLTYIDSEEVSHHLINLSQCLQPPT